MLDVAIYLFIAYIVILGPAFFFVRAHIARRTPGLSATHRLFFFSLYWLCPLLPYAAVEGQTIVLQPLLRPAISAALREDGEHDRYKNCKVLLLTPWAAMVYVVSEVSPGLPEKPYNTGFTMTLVPTRHGWIKQGEMDCVWSDGGSADGNVFPPYPTGEAYRTAKR